MKNYRFIIGLGLSLIGTIWLISVVRAPVPSDGVMAFFVVRAKRADANLALLLVVLGLGFILADAFTENTEKAERRERKKEVLREEIMALLSLTDQSLEELNLHIQEVYGRTGLVGLDLKHLRRLKRDMRNRINRSDTEKNN